MGCQPSKGDIAIQKEGHKPKPTELVEYSAADTPFYRCFPEETRDVKFAPTGLASETLIPAITVAEILRKAVAAHGNDFAMKVERPCPPLDKNGVPPPPLPEEEWTSWTYKEYQDESFALAKYLISMGVESKDAVNVMGFNAPEWFMAQVGVVCAGALVAGIYPTDNAEQVCYKAVHSGSSAAVVEDKQKFERFEAKINEIPKLKVIVAWDYDFDGKTELEREDGSKVTLITWKNAVAKGATLDQASLDARIDALRPGDCCTLIYTSGTTGRPKAVMCTHDNLNFEARSVQFVVPTLGWSGQERIISYLPLSHVAALMVDVVCPLSITAHQTGFCTAYFARPYDLKAGSLGDRLRAVRPTIFLGVPRVWEKVAEKLKAKGAETKGLKKKLVAWAKAKGMEYQNNCQLGGSGMKPAFYGLAEKIVLNKIKAALGLEECKFALTGAAPIEASTLRYFGGLGININELYGMSECSGATTMSTDRSHVWGSIGWASPGTEVKIFNFQEDGTKIETPNAKDLFHPTEKEQGEICYRGRHIMLGYMAQHDLGPESVKETIEKNKAAIDEEGWLHSGDKACRSEDGMFRICGRYKELIIGAGGENIAPVPIEEHAKSLCPAISNLIMIGDKRKFNVALVTLVTEGATGEAPGSGVLAGASKNLSSSSKTTEDAIKDPEVIKAIKAAIQATNSNGEVVENNASKIGKFSILKRDFSVEGGELTATLKTKRSVVAEKYVKTLDALYAADKEAVYVETLD